MWECVCAYIWASEYAFLLGSLRVTHSPGRTQTNQNKPKQTRRWVNKALRECQATAVLHMYHTIEYKPKKFSAQTRPGHDLALRRGCSRLLWVPPSSTLTNSFFVFFWLAILDIFPPSLKGWSLSRRAKERKSLWPQAQSPHDAWPIPLMQLLVCHVLVCAAWRLQYANEKNVCMLRHFYGSSNRKPVCLHEWGIHGNAPGWFESRLHPEQTCHIEQRGRGVLFAVLVLRRLQLYLLCVVVLFSLPTR